MNLSMAYAGKSRLITEKGLMTLNFQPNLSRSCVAFESRLLKPLRFREAISALHDVVISDLRFKPRDKSDYERWKKQETEALTQARRGANLGGRGRIELEKSGLAPDIVRNYKYYRRIYWKARDLYEQYVAQNDPELWRMIMPYDPVITVAGDILFFECFSADESAYGRLTVNRDEGFSKSDSVQLGTTNVDYSWDLYNHFQRLRTYRDTMFKLDPRGFEIRTGDSPGIREEKIDLPQGWLRGFMQIQAAMGLPMKSARLTRDSVYALLAWLKDHREKTGPRAIRFELIPGEAPRLILEPWEKVIRSHGTIYDGPPTPPIRVWGRRRLLSLARLPALAESFQVFLLGSGLPSFWLVEMGEMSFTLGLSGWTANDWTRGSAVDLLSPPIKPMDSWIQTAAEFLQSRQAASFQEIDAAVGYGHATTASVLNHLARCGQVIRDLGSDVHRWRQILPMAVGEAETNEPDPELAASMELAQKGTVRIVSSEPSVKGAKLVKAVAGDFNVELIIDQDGVIKKGACKCDHHRRYGLKNGPCRHLLAARRLGHEMAPSSRKSLGEWYHNLEKWSNN